MLSITHRVLYGAVPEAQRHADALIVLSSKQGFPHWLARGRIYRGWALVVQGTREGIEQLRDGIAAARATGAEMWYPYFLTLLADAYLRLGRPQDGLALFDEASAVLSRTDQQVSAPEQYRVQGELYLRAASAMRGDTEASAAAEACFLKAIDIARAQHSRSLELRSTLRLSRLWQRTSRKAEACQRLAELYGWFTEGFDTPDLQEANTFLSQPS